VNSTQVQWVAEPFINATGYPVVLTNTGSICRHELPDITVVQLNSAIPFRTAMLVNGNIQQSINVTCRDITTGESSAEMYQSGGKYGDIMDG
jgi:hypothetical protein